MRFLTLFMLIFLVSCSREEKTMQPVTIYTTQTCPYCVKAKKLLERKGVHYTEVDVSDETERTKMIEKASGSRTVPQIFIGSTHVGGCDDLYALESEGKLDALLSGVS